MQCAGKPKRKRFILQRVPESPQQPDKPTTPPKETIARALALKGTKRNNNARARIPSTAGHTNGLVQCPKGPPLSARKSHLFAVQGLVPLTYWSPSLAPIPCPYCCGHYHPCEIMLHAASTSLRTRHHLAARRLRSRSVWISINLQRTERVSGIPELSFTLRLCSRL